MGILLDLKLQIDHRLLSVVNLYRGLQLYKLSSIQKQKLAANHHKFANTAKSKKVLICGNGPSLNELNFADFTDTATIAANYFYKHTEAKVLNPQYYVIIDSKVVHGIWPVTMIDEILTIFPETQLFLDVRWMTDVKLQPYLDNPRVNWILPNLFPHAYFKPRHSLKRSLCGLNVVSSAISLATCMGFTEIGIAGVDGDGLFREILNTQSHFYDGDKDVSLNSFTSMVKSLVLSTENLWAWQGIVNTHQSNGIIMSNICKSGIMDCMPRISPSVFLNK